jgi:pilus assembly protein FimV
LHFRLMRKMQTRFYAFLCIAFLFVGGNTKSFAYTLGDVEQINSIGEPLKVQIGILEGSARNAVACLSIASGPASGEIPWVGPQARIIAVLEGSSAIEVFSDKQVDEPVLRLRLRDNCHARFQRDYTLSFPPPRAFVPLPPPVAKPAPVPPVVRSPLQDASETAELASADPPLPLARPRPIPGTRVQKEEAQPPVPPREMTETPPPVDVSEGNVPASAQASEAPIEAPIPESGARSASADAVRIASPLDEANMTGTAPPSFGQRERKALIALDDQMARQLELDERIRRLGLAQVELKNEMLRLNELTERLIGVYAQTSQPGQRPPPLPIRQGEPGPVSSPLSDSPPMASLPTSPPQPAAEPRPVFVPSDYDIWRDESLRLVLAGLALLGIALLFWMIRKRRQDTMASADIEVLSIDPHHAPLAQEHPPLASKASGLTLAKTSPTGLPESGHVSKIIPIEETPVHEKEPEEHESAVELADIMLSFGRAEGAAETLAEFIQSNPRQSVTPWLKLLDVYRVANMTDEFNALAQQLNKTFNVIVVTWENYEELRKSSATVEQMGHITRRLQEIWRTPTCQAYLKELILDNRDGTRQGFPLPVVDELLTLSGILELELGPCRDDIFLGES